MKENNDIQSTNQGDETQQNKIYDTTPFDTKRTPPKQNLFFMPAIWAVCWFLTRSGKLKIHKENMKGLKPPYLVLGTHHAFMDFYVTPLALFPHRANYVSELEGFEAYGEWLYRQAGCLGTRKFINDINLVKNIRKVMKRKGILVIYPEARYANVGTSSELPTSTGKLVKLLGVPLVTINMKGNYLQSPIWNLKQRKGVKLDTTLTQVLTAEEVKTKSVEEINALISKHLAYDEYKYQLDNKIKITYKDRAKGLEMPLYQCKSCGAEFTMTGQGTRLSCCKCNATWEMDELGRLVWALDNYIGTKKEEKTADATKKNIDNSCFHWKMDLMQLRYSLPRNISIRNKKIQAISMLIPLDIV